MAIFDIRIVPSPDTVRQCRPEKQGRPAKEQKGIRVVMRRFADFAAGRTRGARLLYCAALALLAARVHAVPDWPELEAPPKAHVEWVGQDMKLNGVPVQVRKFDSALDPAEILTFYRARWGTQREKKSVENQRGPWHIIGRAHGPYYLTVQVKQKPNAGSEGMLSVSMLTSNIKPEIAAGDLPIPGATQVMSVLDSNDPGKLSKQVTLANGDTVESNTRFYEAALKSNGWDKQALVQSKAREQVGTYNVFQKKNQELHLAITKPPQSPVTVIVANTVTYGN
jgi:hypothetical protein